MKLILLFLFSLIFFAGCYRIPNEIHPQVHDSVQDTYLQRLSSPFPPLTLDERSQRWGEEYLIAQKFAKSLDLYRAITAFKRAEFLLPPTFSNDRLAAIQYQILLCYYFGKRYDDVIQEFADSTLYKVSNTFPPHCDLFVILYDSYLKTGDERKGASILRKIEKERPELAEKLQLSTDLIEGNLKEIAKTQKKEETPSDLKILLKQYNSKKRSIGKAQMLNALLPGAGYYYVGQKQSAFTSFFLNALSTWAAIHFFKHGHTGAGILMTSVELGWYFGGIHGAGESAKFYNERLYEKEVRPLMNQSGLFPVFMLKYGF